MIRYFKLIFIYSLLFVSSVLSGQDSIFSEFHKSLDSLHNRMTMEMDQRIRGLRYRFDSDIENQNILIDSLILELHSQKEKYRKLVLENEMMVRKIAEVNQSVLTNKIIIQEEHKKFRRLLLISGPSLLALVILCAVLFFILINRYQDQTDKKISALKKYTHSEIEDTRNVLVKKLKKRLKKLSRANKK